MEKEQNNKVVYKEIFIQSAKKEALLYAQQEIEKHISHCEELNSALDLFHKYKNILQLCVKSISEERMNRI